MASKIPSNREIDKEFEFVYSEVFEEFSYLIIRMTEGMESITPVDTGFLRESYSPVPRRINKTTLRVENSANYSYKILIEGGSNQLPQGVLPFVRYYLKKHGGKK